MTISRDEYVEEIEQENRRLRMEHQRMLDLVDWVNSWVSNPVGSYSVSALDGLFGMTRDKISALWKK